MTNETALDGADKDSELNQLRQRIAALEDSLRQSQRVTQAIIDQIPGTIFIRDTNWRYIMFNTEAAKVLGSHESILGKVDTDIFPPHVISAWRKSDEQILATGKPYETEEVVPQQDGLHIYRSLKFPLVDGAGKICAIGGMAIDITVQRRAEQQVKQRDELLRSILHSTPIAIYSVDEQGVFTFAEGKGLQTLGLDTGGMIGSSVFERWKNSPAQLARVREALAGIPVNTIEEYGQRALETWYLPAPDEITGKNGMIGVSLDVTERRQAEREQTIQAQRIAAQEDAIRELSTPLIPLTDDAVVVPLIGSMDTIRTNQFMETLLNGVSTRRASVVIIDVTGVSIVDTQVADSLIRAARAVRLLGAQVLMTGISASMAQTLVQLGINFDSVMICGSLQDGVMHVLQMARTKRRGS